MITNNLINLNNNAGIYIRLSQEDKNKKYESDSESINNQKEMLVNYCKTNAINFIDEYVDDGFSGTNFDRPEFIRMLKDIEKKKINVVIVKDLSRLGRDHIETGKYIENYFPEHNVKFISILENFDSSKVQASNDASTFIIAVNDYYSKQNSIKIRSVLDSKRQEGKFIGSMASYGYKKDPSDKGRLLIDENVSQNVKDIFEMRVKGIGISEIATYLNNKNIPTPSSYKNISKSSRLINMDVWTISSVRKILQNEMYTGTMVQHTQSKLNYKSKKKVKVDDSLWIKIPNTHEAIIDAHTFKIINDRRIKKERTSSLKTDREKRILEGLLYCDECGNKLGVSFRKNKNYWTINCNKYARDPVRKACTPHFFPYNLLEEQILGEIKNLFNTIFSYIDIDEMNNELIKRTTISNNSTQKIYNKKKQELNKLSNIITTAYQDRIEAIISANEFKIITSPYKEKIKLLESELKILEKEIKLKKLNDNKIPSYTNGIKILLNKESLNRDLIHSLIEKITIDYNKNIKIKFIHNLLSIHEFKYIKKRQ